MSNDLLKREPSYTNKKSISIAKKMGRRFTLADAVMTGKKIGIDWKTATFKASDLLVGMHYELEHGKVDKTTDVTNDSKIKTAKIAWAHLKERPDYYVQLAKIDPPTEAHGKEKKASDILNEMYKEALALSDITCEVCGYTGKPDKLGRCPVCFALCGKQAPEYYKKNDDPRTIADDGSVQEEAEIENILENITAY